MTCCLQQPISFISWSMHFLSSWFNFYMNNRCCSIRLSSGKCFLCLLVTRQLAVVVAGALVVVLCHELSQVTYHNYNWPNYGRTHYEQATIDQIVTDQISVKLRLSCLSSGYNLSNYWPNENPWRFRVKFYGLFVANLFWLLGLCSNAVEKDSIHVLIMTYSVSNPWTRLLFKHHKIIMI